MVNIYFKKMGTWVAAILVVAAGIVVFGVMYYSFSLNKTTPADSGQNYSGNNQQTLSYQNTRYGFELQLPNSWKGYSAVESSWQGRQVDNNLQSTGPEIIIRSPRWTENEHWQDIPIMVFTKIEWKLIEQENLAVSAAPIGPGKLGENDNYVFALPPRWVGFTDDKGQDEAQKITQTFKAIYQQTNSTETTDWKTYKSDKYGFEIKYPLADNVETLGNEIDFTAYANTTRNPKIQFQIIKSSEFNGSCDYNIKGRNVTTEQFLIDNVSFTKVDVSGFFEGSQTRAYADEYCAARNGFTYRLTPVLSWSGVAGESDTTHKRSELEEDITINQMLSTFKFTK